MRLCPRYIKSWASGAEARRPLKGFPTLQIQSFQYIFEQLPLMFLRPCCTRTAIPLSWLSRSTAAAMPLKAKILDPAFSRSASSVSSLSEHPKLCYNPAISNQVSRCQDELPFPKKNPAMTPTTSSSTQSTASAPSSSTGPKSSTPSTAPWHER